MLLKFLLRGVALSSYAPASSAAAARPAEADARLLYACLSAMYGRAEEFGGSLFALAAGVMTDLIHHEPQSYRQLQEAGLTEAFLAAVKVRARASLGAGSGVTVRQAWRGRRRCRGAGRGIGPAPTGALVDGR